MDMRKNDITSSISVRFALKGVGIETPLDVLENFPRRYEDLSSTPLKNGFYQDKERIVVEGRLLNKPKSVRFKNADLCRFDFESLSGEPFSVTAWNRPYLASSLVSDDTYTIIGTYDKKRRALSLLNIYKGSITPEESIKPVYSLPSEVSNRVYVSIVKRCLRILQGQIPDIVPEELMAAYSLPHREEAFRSIHFPEDEKSLRNAVRLFKYEEALLFELLMAKAKVDNRPMGEKPHRMVPREAFWDFVRSLPYRLTDSQNKALLECLDDMDSPRLMYRLLQGDVGSGKTLVASLLCFAAYLRGEQAAFMAPTESLARQHYKNLSRLFGKTGAKVVLLTGSQRQDEKERAREDALEGEGDIFVGTHALIAKSLRFRSLGFAAIDEQHKFGVDQRALLAKKGDDTDLLLMSATPIPRSLAMTAFGDLDISTLDSFPSGKREVETRVAKGPKELKDAIYASLKRNGRAYVIAPEIEEKGDKPFVGVKALYDGYEAIYGERVSLLHGKMGMEEKIEAMESFSLGKTPIIVATSLVEVGLDVPEADLMIVYHPTHFSLSSLHQLRGRIGRNGGKALFLLVPEEGISEEAEKKLEVIASETDGFKIAEWDLKLRGPGDFGGTRQSGLPPFRFLGVSDDYRVFIKAREDAGRLICHLSDSRFASLKEAYARALKRRATGS